ncbi:MAG: 23S rRNA (pseudouridine(1915)-N(3))-methyltransferase RlmH [Alphaproteobacteria bacterium]|nr:23S rRNA (pseudouridine(1915)-N(3))-methyltransferase RlmH [Alphaproteobacteria bacterium]
MKFSLIAVGKMKDRAQRALYDDYAVRLSPPPTLIEIPQANGQAEAQAIEKHIDAQAFVVVLDERGKLLTSMEFANSLQTAMNNGKSHLQVIIGGAEGLTDGIRARANLMLAFGKMTWPHMMVRIMVLEQVYRARQILAGHPYHREG